MLYKSNGRTIFNIVNYSLLTVLCALCLLPFINLLAISFSGSAAVAAGQVTFWPVNFTLQSYAFAFRGGKFLAALWVSVQRVALGTSINLILMILTAYPLSKNTNKVAGRNIYMGYFVITMLINGGLIPTYLLVSKLGLLNTMWALVLPTALPIYSMLILMNFLRSLPGDLEDAALIDGTGPFGALVFIILPVMKPALATVGLFSIVAHWNDWFSGMIYIQHPMNYPLQTYLQSLIVNIEDLIKTFSKDYIKLVNMMNARTGRAAQLFLGALPVIMVYPFLQKYFVTGLIIGSVKG